MSRMKLLMASAIASAFVFLGGAVAPVVAFAEEGVNGAETSEIVSVEEVIEETESVENTANDEVVEEATEKTEVDLDDLLAFVGEIAKKEGYEDEWEKALYYVETAASEKKVEVMIGLSVAIIVMFVVDRFVKIINWAKAKKYDTTSKDLKDIKSSSGAQTDAINGLIDEVNEENVKMADSIKREKALANATQKQNTAIRCLIRGTNIKQDLKDEAFRSLNESDDLCDEAKK